METINIPIHKNEFGKIQYLSEVLPAIPTNSIVCKTLTGLGATYGELKAKRNSIIIEPNTPVIEGKYSDPKHADDNILRVYEGVSQDDVVAYIESSKEFSKKMKILTTPESFRKVQNACWELGIDLRKEFFLLLDECHKPVKDVDYRSDITIPINTFFECEHKAMVSATPIDMSDPRFAQAGFKKIVIRPEFDYRQLLSLIITNNVLQSVRESLKTLASDDRPIFFFCNSTDMTYAFMDQLGILDDSYVFCSDKSVRKLKEVKGFKSASSSWSARRMKKFNWMTSRFYSAVDIILEERPHVVLISECYHIDYTMFDPFTDVPQVLGRFRNGIASATHISNTNSNFSLRSKEEIIGYMQCSKDIYEKIMNLYNLSARVAEKDAYLSAANSLPHHKLLDEYGNISWFRWDNEIDERMLRSFYSSERSLEQCYAHNPLLYVVFTSKHYEIGDTERLKLESMTLSLKEKRKEIVAQLELLGACETELEQSYKQSLIEADRFIVEAYDELGKDAIEHLHYSFKRIKEAMIVSRFKKNSRSTAIEDLIDTYFQPGRWYSDANVKATLERLYKKLGIRTPSGGITSKTIGYYFDYKDARRKIKKKDVRGKSLLNRKG